MHELPIAKGIMDAAIPAAREAGAKRITAVRLKVGELAGIVPECVQEYLSLLGEGTEVEGAKIVCETIPASITCEGCGYNGAIERGKVRCPACGSTQIRLSAGWEYFIESIEVE